MGIALTLILVVTTATWLPQEAHRVINNVTTSIQCTAQNYVQMVMSRYMVDFEGCIQRNADMLANGVVRQMCM